VIPWGFRRITCMAKREPDPELEELAAQMDAAVAALRKSLHPSRMGYVPEPGLVRTVEDAAVTLQLQAYRMHNRAAGRPAGA